LFYKPLNAKYLLETFEKVGSVTPQLKSLHNQLTSKDIQNMGTLSPLFKNRVSGEKIISKLSYSHIEILLSIDDNLKRTFYEIECIKGVWSVRELKRQINSAYFERSVLSAKPEKRK